MAHEPVPLEFERLTPEEQLDRSRAFLGLMNRRRSVREFSREPVPFELIENAVVVAGLAPSGANQQPWTFVAVSEPDLKRRIREAAEREERISYERRMPVEWLEALEPLGTDWSKPHIEDAPYMIVVFEQTYGLTDGLRRKHYYAKESVGIAVGFLLAALHASGLVALTHTPSPMGFLADVLERPPNERAFCLIPVGYPADGASVPAISKKRIDEILVQM